MPAKVYGSEKSFRTQKVLIAAKLAKANVTLAGTKPPHDKFPLGETPAYEDGSVHLFGAEAIAMHLAGEVLKTGHCAEVLQWLQWAEGNLLPRVLGFVLPSVSAAHVDNKVVEASKSELLAQLKGLDAVLQTRTYLVGERMSIADISLALDLLPAYEYVLDAGLRAPYTNVNRWFKTIINQQCVKEVLGEVVLATKTATFDQATFKELSAKMPKREKSAHKKGKGGDKKEKEHKPKPAPKVEEQMDATEQAMASEPKDTDPMATMPKGTFVMDAFKRVYSNEDTETKAIPYFWENFDAQANSVWYAEYKFPEELTLTFMSCNLIGGMFQRLEKLKKYGFASVCLFGTDNASTISGIWMWRGHELAFPLCPDWQIDYESYNWTKLDPADEKTKKMINEYLMWEGDFDGKKFNQGKIFK